MQVIELDATAWRDVLDYYGALKIALGSCHGHGSSPDAWVDSMLYGGMNEIEPPYTIRISGTSTCDEELKQEILLLADVIREAREWKLEHYGVDVDVRFQIEPSKRKRRWIAPAPFSFGVCEDAMGLRRREAHHLEFELCGNRRIELPFSICSHMEDAVAFHSGDRVSVKGYADPKTVVHVVGDDVTVLEYDPERNILCRQTYKAAVVQPAPRRGAIALTF